MPDMNPAEKFNEVINNPLSSLEKCNFITLVILKIFRHTFMDSETYNN